MNTDQNPKKVLYRISFILNGNKDSFDYDAETPFQTVSVGDEIGGLTFNPGGLRSPVARVTKVVRTIAMVDSEAHDTTLVYCEPVTPRS